MACDTCVDKERAYLELKRDQLKEYVRRHYIENREARIEQIRQYSIGRGRYPL